MVPLRAGRFACVLGLTFVLGGCARAFFGLPAVAGSAPASMPNPGSTGKPRLTVVLTQNIPQRREVEAALARTLGPDFDVAFAELPNRTAALVERGSVEQDLVAARRAYTNAEFSACLSHAGERNRAVELLGDGERLLAERLLFWRVACHVGAGRNDEARREATAFATFELDVPPDVEVAAPDVDALLADAAHGVETTPRAPLAIRAHADVGKGLRFAPRIAVGVDGRAAVCAIPCTLDLRPGDHAVRVAADGFVAETRPVRVAATGGEVGFELVPAGPELAAQQWMARYAGGPAIDSPASLGLLTIATRARGLAVLAAEPAAVGTRLHGVVAIDGGISTRAERIAGTDGEMAEVASALARDLLLRGNLLVKDTPLHERPLFWITIGAAAIAVATVTTLLLYHPEDQIRVTLGLAR